MTDVEMKQTVETIIAELKGKSMAYADKFRSPIGGKGKVGINKYNAFIIGVRYGIAITINSILDHMPEDMDLDKHRLLNTEDDPIEEKRTR